MDNQLLRCLEMSLVYYKDVLQLKTNVFNCLDVAENTRKEYLSRIKHFIHFIKLNGINPNSYLEYKRYLSSIDTLSVSTKNKYLISAKILLDGVNHQAGALPFQINTKVRGFKQSKLHKKDGLCDEDISKIVEYCSSLEPTIQNLRLKSILSLLIFQGLRQVEITRLNVSDINLKDKTAFIIGKGQYDKELIHLHPSTVKALKSYLQKYRVRDGALFRSESNFSSGSRLTTKSIREIIKKVLNELDIDGSTHGFRHFFITKLIKSYKGELLTVSKYSRHRSIQMLEVYNDEIIREQDLPRFYNVFSDITL